MKKEQKPEVLFKHNDLDYLRLDSETELNLDSIIKNLSVYMEQNSGKGKTDDEKDELYKNAQVFWNEFRDALTIAKFNIHLNKDEYNLLTNILISKLEYDVDTVFVGIELTNALAELRKTKFENSDDLYPFKVNPTEMTYTYHLIAKYKVKGLTKEAYTFASILRRIGETSKLFNFYDKSAKFYSEFILSWVSSFEEGVTLEGHKPTEEVESVEVSTN